MVKFRIIEEVKVPLLTVPLERGILLTSQLH